MEAATRRLTERVTRPIEIGMEVEVAVTLQSTSSGDDNGRVDEKYGGGRVPDGRMDRLAMGHSLPVSPPRPCS